MIGQWLGSCWYWYDIPLLGGMLIFDIWLLIGIIKEITE